MVEKMNEEAKITEEMGMEGEKVIRHSIAQIKGSFSGAAMVLAILKIGNYSEARINGMKGDLKELLVFCQKTLEDVDKETGTILSMRS